MHVNTFFWGGGVRRFHQTLQEIHATKRKKLRTPGVKRRHFENAKSCMVSAWLLDNKKVRDRKIETARERVP